MLSVQACLLPVTNDTEPLVRVAYLGSYGCCWIIRVVITKGCIKQSFIAGIYSIITIGILTILTYKTESGLFLIASFGSSMVLLYGYPESPFAQPKNIFFGHLLTAIVGMFFLYFVPLPLYILIPLAVGFGVGLMIFLNVTHPPAGGNPIIVIMGSVSPDYILNPIISGSVIILGFGIIINRFILKKSYPKSK